MFFDVDQHVIFLKTLFWTFHTIFFFAIFTKNNCIMIAKNVVVNLVFYYFIFMRQKKINYLFCLALINFFNITTLKIIFNLKKFLIKFFLKNFVVFQLMILLYTILNATKTFILKTLGTKKIFQTIQTHINIFF